MDTRPRLGVGDKSQVPDSKFSSAQGRTNLSSGNLTLVRRQALGLCWLGLGRQLGVAPKWACASTCPGPFPKADWVRLGRPRQARVRAERRERRREGAAGPRRPQAKAGY